MTQPISMYISDKAYQRFVELKNALGQNQNDAMSSALENMDIQEIVKKVK